MTSTRSSMLHQEVRKRNVGLHYDEPSYFVNAQWRCMPPYMLILYRTAVAGYCFVWLLWTAIKEGVLQHQGNMFWVYLTNWILLVLNLHTVISAFATFYHHIIRARHKRFSEAIDRDVDFPMSVSTEPITLNAEEGETVEVRVITDVTIYTPCHLRLAWLLYEISLSNTLLLTLVYWLFVYDSKFTDVKFNNNFLTSILLIIDIFITKYPIRLLHGIYGIAFFLLYILFNIVYCHIGQTFPHGKGKAYIYPVLDWRKPMIPATGVAVICLLFLPAAHVFWFALYQMRLYLWRRYGQGGTI